MGIWKSGVHDGVEVGEGDVGFIVPGGSISGDSVGIIGENVEFSTTFG